jgi:serine/threonine protein kinase
MAPTPANPADPALGGRVGPYVLTGVLGQGGFGVVYAAERREPFQQRVALKVLQPGHGPAIIARFEQERQALALMDHPGVARVLDGGLTDAASPFGAGRPYFVMELVEGPPITRHCQEHALGLRARLELFMAVCDAVQHAHMKGVIHRDLKPGNVLVATVDGRPAPKVIDFGIAKAIAGAMTDRPVFTEQGQFLGTPEYMSPEQASASPDVDTRTDVYSLGVILYELLAGTLPFPSDELRRAGHAEILRIIREVDPPRPSTRVSEASRVRSEAARTRRTRTEAGAPATLVRALRGDLDWVVMRALEKPRARRYESPGSLAADLRRYLRTEPVEAGPPSAAYRLARFVRRRRGLVAAASVSLAALVGGLGAALYGLSEARAQRDAAVEARAAAERARDLQEQERRRADATVRFVTRSLEMANPSGGRVDLTMAQVLDRLAENIDGSPLPAMSKVGERGLIASAYRSLGRPEDALRILDPVMVSLMSSGQAGSLPHAQVSLLMARAYTDAGKFSQAEDAATQCLAAARALPAPDGPLLTARSLAARGVARWKGGEAKLGEGDLRDAIDAWKAAIAAAPATRAPDEEADAALGLAEATDALALLLCDRPGRQDEALALAEEALRLRSQHAGERSGEVEASLHNIARVHRERGDLDAAIRGYRKALAIAEARVNPLPRPLAQTRQALAVALRDADRPDEAQPLADKALEARRQKPVMNLELAETLDLCAGLRLDRGDAKGAIDLYQEEVTLLSPMLRVDAPLSRALTGLAGALLADSPPRPADALPHARKAYALRQKILEPGDWRLWSTAGVLAQALAETGRADEALALAGPAAESIWASTTVPPKRKRPVLERAARVCEMAGHPADAARWRERLGALAALPPPSPGVASTLGGGREGAGPGTTGAPPPSPPTTP